MNFAAASVAFKVEINDAVVNLAREIGAASDGVYARVSDIFGLVNEEAARIEAGGYVWENYRDEHRGGSYRPVNRKTRKAVFEAVCFAVSRNMDFAEALRAAADYENRWIVRPRAAA